MVDQRNWQIMAKKKAKKGRNKGRRKGRQKGRRETQCAASNAQRPRPRQARSLHSGNAFQTCKPVLFLPSNAPEAVCAHGESSPCQALGFLVAAAKDELATQIAQPDRFPEGNGRSELGGGRVNVLVRGTNKTN